MIAPRKPSIGRTAGHTLIELMVAIIVGLLLVLAAFQVLATFEGHKRTTTAMDDALQSANVGLYQLDTLVRSAGTGIVQVAKYAYGCPLNYSTNGGTGAAISDGAATLSAPFSGIVATAGGRLRLAPAVIFPGAIANAATGGSDVLVLMSGGGGYGETPVHMTSVPVGTQLLLTNTVGFFPKEWVLLSQGVVNPSTATSCMLTRVTAAYVAETTSNSTGNVTLPLTQGSVGAATLAGFGATGLVAAMGTDQGASFIVYGVDNDYTLKSIDLLNSDLTVAPQVVSEDIVTLRAVYGINTAGVGPLTWVKPLDSGANLYSPASLLDGTAAARTRLSSIKAIRVAVVVRAPLNEGTDAGGRTIDATHAVNAGSFTLFSSLPSTVQVTWTNPTGQTGYRFRELEATIPLRNASF